MELIHAFDTETSGLPKNGLPDDHPSQPRLVQYAAVLYDGEGREIQSASVIVKPDGWTIPEEAAKVHGITTEIAALVGIPLPVVVGLHYNLRAIATRCVGHNIDFDQKIMRFAAAQIGKNPTHPGPRMITCTVNETVDIIRLPPTDRMIAAGFGHKHKNPNLGEAYKFFFDEELVGAHDALVDVRASARIFFELRRREALKNRPKQEA